MSLTLNRVAIGGALLVLFGFGAAYIFSEDTVAEYSSSYNGAVLVTRDLRGVYRMRFSGDISVQSAMDSNNPDRLVSAYTFAAVDALKSCQDRPYRVLVLGLGGGIIPTALQRRCAEVAVDAVEIDPMVVRAAYEFFGVRAGRRMAIHVADAVAFVGDRAERSEAAYDAVVVDIFNGISAPPSSELQPFVHNLRSLVKPDGVVVLNLLSSEFNPSHERVVGVYRSVFSSVSVQRVRGSGNFLLTARP